MKPLVSVVTPFYNTQDYLAECIESVLSQTYSNWEYVLINNCSSDRSAEIAESYVKRDQRLRLLHNRTLLTQTQNYNHALRQIASSSQYCKMVQADDKIFPDCIEKMVELAERNPSVGIVGSYIVTEQKLLHVGPPLETSVMRGVDACRMELLDGLYMFGAPTHVLFRADMVRSNDPFFPENCIANDIEACYQRLRTWDFGFVHQILSFRRTANHSITSKVRDFDTWLLYKFLMLKKQGHFFLDPHEYRREVRRAKRYYFQILGKNVFRRRPAEFWEYHRKALNEFGYRLTWPELLWYAALEFMDAVGNPKRSVGTMLRAMSGESRHH